MAGPAEAFPLGVILQDEMDARGWTSFDVALRMGGSTSHEVAVDHCCVELALHIRDPDLILDEETARKLGRAFDVNPQYFLNLSAAYREWAKYERDTPDDR